VIHLRIVSPPDRSERVLEVLENDKAVCNVVFLEGVARAPAGDVVLADVAREDASVVIGHLKELRLEEDGSIAIEDVDAHLSRRADLAEEYAKGEPSDAVVWEEVEARTSESTELSHAFLVFMIVAGLIAGVAIYLDSPVLLVGAMVVGPEFGPVAGVCVAAATRRPDLARRSLTALAVGFPATITAVWLATLAFKAFDLIPEDFDSGDHALASFISSPDFFAFFVAICAGVAGVLSLSTAKSGALIGVLISVTTIPAAAHIGIASAYGDWPAWRGSIGQLALNLGAILVAGTVTLLIQRLLFVRRWRHHG
jgi:uncharacterized hydrophobic protein (TIGR00271 family)